MKHVTFDWNLTSHINEIASAPTPWLSKLEKIALAILVAYDQDGISIITLPPLKVTMLNIVKTPREDGPDTVVVLSDSSPPIANDWANRQSVLSRVLKTGQPQFGKLLDQAQVLDEDLADVFLGFYHINLQAIVPIGVGNAPSGAIILGNTKPTSTLTIAQQEALRPLGQHVFLTLQNANLVEIANHQAKQIAILNRIARTITSSLEIDEVLQRTILGIDEILDVEAGALVLADKASNDLYFKMILRGVERIITDFRLQIGEGIAGWVYQHQKPALVNDVHKDPRFSHRIDQNTGFITQSALCVPLVVQDVPIGSLEVLNKRQGDFILDDLHLLTSMTASLAVAIQNSTLFQQVQEQVKHMEYLNSLTTDINANLSFSDTTKAIIAELDKIFTFEQAILGLLDESKVTIQHTVLDKQGEVIFHLPPISLSDSYFKQVLTAQTNLSHFHVFQDIQGAEQQPFLEHGIETIISVLLEAENNEFGLFSLTNMNEDDFSDKNMKQLTHIAPTLSSALEKARLIDAMEQRTTELEELNLLSERLLTNTEPSYILDTALKYIPRLLPGAVHGLILIDGDALVTGLRLPENATEELKDQVCQEMLESLKNSLHDQQDICITEVRSTYDNSAVVENWRPQSKLAWPILTLRGSLGVVYLAYSEQSGITADRIRLFSLVVSRISGTIENARLFMEVKQERAKLASVLSSTADGILVIDLMGRVIVDNPAANQILEHTESQQGQVLKEITDNEDLLLFFDRAEKAGNAAGEFTTLDDKTYYTIVSPVTVMTDLGKTTGIGWVAVMQDVTHFKEINEAKDNFVSAVSHDLRSPLSGISLALQLIQMTGDMNERQQEFMQTIHEHIEAMTTLIDGLLDVGKIEADIDMQMEIHPILPILNKTISSLRPQAEQKSLNLTVNLADSIPRVKCNLLRLEQVFNNLISNAIKYTPPEGAITVNLAKQDEHLLFQVIDTGTGIPPADQPHIFEKFYRVRGEHMTGIKGSGLGLAITKSIVEKHQGKIWVDSKFKGGGSTFSVLLPASNGISAENPS